MTQQRHESASEARFSQEEIGQIVDAALERKYAAQSPPADAYTGSIEDAREVARALNISDDLVEAAARELMARRSASGAQRVTAAGKRRLLVRTAALAGAGLLVILAGSLLHLPFWLVAAAGGLLLLSAAVSLVFSLLSSGIAPLPGEIGPTPGICRVCGKPAHSPRATFCEEHRYRAPASAP